MSPGYISPSNRMDFNLQVWDLVRMIPAGRVATYGQIASLIPLPDGVDETQFRAFGARWVGSAMASCPDDVPWQRVVNAQGKISLPPGAGNIHQRQLLESEGIVFDERGRINLKIYQWTGPQTELLTSFWHSPMEEMMTSGTAFAGFPKESVLFLENLRENNQREWFNAHKQDYERDLIEPAQEFVVTLGERLHKIAPGIHAEPRIDRSIFRLHRDTRFSPDKTPYKAHLGIWLWEGDLPKMENSGFYFHLEPPNLMLGVGIHTFSKSYLQTYRTVVQDSQLGAELVEIINQIMKAGKYYLGGKYYKRVPRGYDPAHERGELLLYNGLYAGTEGAVPPILYTNEIIEYCFDIYQNLFPLHRWLLTVARQIPTNK